MGSVSYECRTTASFSLLSDSLENDLNTFTLNYYLAFKGVWQQTG